MRLHSASLLAALLAAAPLAAQDTTTTMTTAEPATPAVARLRGIGRFGAEYGGDKVLEFQYEDGSTPDVTAGGGVTFSLGAAYRALQAKAGGLDLQATAGVKYRTIPAASNQEASWLRFPLEAMAMYRTTRGFGIGAGATAHVGNKLSVDGDAANGAVKFDATPGAIVQAEWAFRTLLVDVRYTAIRYQPAGSSAKVDASNIGVGVGTLFGKRGAR